MARPKKLASDRRDVSRLVRFTVAEDTVLQQRAEQSGRNVSDLLRDAALRRKFAARPPLAEADFLLYVRGEIGRAGNNLNQLVQRLNAANMAPSAAAAQLVIEQLHEINTAVLKLLRHGHSW